MTEEKAEDTLRVGIEELLEKEGACWGDVVKVVQKHDMFFDEDGESFAYAQHGNYDEALRFQVAEISLPHVHKLIKWLQDNFLPKGKKDDRQADSKTDSKDA